MHLISRIVRFLFLLLFQVMELFFAFLVVFFLFIVSVSQIKDPELPAITVAKRIQTGEHAFQIGKNTLQKNAQGVWEMYLEGDAYERGLIYGELAKELIQKQEVHFVNQINDFVPSSAWQHVLRLMIGFFNKDITKNIPQENLEEIYGISKAFSDDYDYISSKYARILNYHAAHDIGHALNDYSLVGCTSFALKGDKTEDSKLLLGRNFDFYVGEEFAEEKLVIFVKPTKGYAFSSYSWAGFTGVASGMNETGLTVTINASKSDLPTKAKTPISIVAREILQYASTTSEAIQIAKKRETFVSETIMVSSKKDKKMILIEKSPTKIGVFEPKGNQLICSNHYQSEKFKSDKVNIQNQKDSDSPFRYHRVEELLNAKKQVTLMDAVSILRNQKGSHNDSLGMGNPKAINQLIAHHSVLFQPESGIFWISTKPYQLGQFVAYDLATIFSERKLPTSRKTIAADAFLKTSAFQNFEAYKKTKKKIIAFLNFNKELNLSPNEISAFVKNNSENYLTHEYLGDYYYKKGKFGAAKTSYLLALKKELASLQVKKEIENKIKNCKK